MENILLTNYLYSGGACQITDLYTIDYHWTRWVQTRKYPDIQEHCLTLRTPHLPICPLIFKYPTDPINPPRSPLQAHQQLISSCPYLPSGWCYQVTTALTEHSSSICYQSFILPWLLPVMVLELCHYLGGRILLSEPITKTAGYDPTSVTHLPHAFTY